MGPNTRRVENNSFRSNTRTDDERENKKSVKLPPSKCTKLGNLQLQIEHNAQRDIYPLVLDDLALPGMETLKNDKTNSFYFCLFFSNLTSNTSPFPLVKKRSNEQQWVSKLRFNSQCEEILSVGKHHRVKCDKKGRVHIFTFLENLKSKQPASQAR